MKGQHRMLLLKRLRDVEFFFLAFLISYSVLIFFQFFVHKKYMLSKNIVIQAQIGRFKCCYVARLALDNCVSMIFYPFIVISFFFRYGHVYNIV